MNTFTLIIKLLAFFLSSIGYWEYFRRKKHINTPFIPIFVISLQVSILYIGGILNFLLPCTYALYVIGLILTIYYLIKYPKDMIKSYIKSEYITLGIMTIFLLIACSGRIFTHYDNFSHWSIVVKNMLLTNRYPSFKDSVIMFQEYPLGSATYIYYVSKLVSSAEGFQMFVQAFMMICCIIPIFKYAKKHRLIISIFIILYSNYLLCYNIKITELLVDTLIGLYGITTLYFIYCNNKKNLKQKVTLLYAIPFLITTMEIKNSGILFVALGCIYIIKNYKEVKLLSKTKLLTLAAPFASLYVWQSHCKYVFYDAATSKHAMTADNYIKEASSKNIYLIKDICVAFFKYMFTGRELHFTLLFIVVLIALSFLGKRSLRKQILKLSGFIVLLYMIYMIGTLLMYIFSMPTDEAIVLAGIGRYRKTILVVIYYILLFESVIILQGITIKVKYILCSIALYTLLISSWYLQSGYFSSIFDYDKGTEAMRTWLEAAIEKYNIPPSSSYIVCINGNDYGYAHFLLKYILMSPNCSWYVDIKEEELKNLENYEYIFVCETNDNLKKWIKKNYPDNIDDEVIITKDKKETDFGKDNKKNDSNKKDKNNDSDKNNKDKDSDKGNKK